jgi:hypothetical protein
MTDAGPPPLAPQPPVRPRRRRRWVTVLLALVLFTAGGVVGSGLTLLVAVRQVRYIIHHPQEFPERAAHRLRSRLHLSDSQTAAVREILAKRQAALQEIRRSVQPQVEAQLEGVRADIDAVLTPEQAAKWNAIFKARMEAWLPPPP